MFKNREEAGKLLAEHLHAFKKRKDVLVLGIARGGIVVAKEIAKKLKLPLDVVVIKKIGAPNNPELAIGASLERGKREKVFRKGKKPLDIKNRTVILVDDGVATGATVLCAQKFLKKESAKKIILAIPVISKETYRHISRYFDRIITLSVEEDFYAVGQFYREFPQVSDEEVISFLSS